MEIFRLIPEAATSFASHIDYLIWTLTALSAFFTVLIGGLIVYFSLRYHRHKQVNRKIQSPDNTALELTWTIIPTFIVLAIFVWAAYLYIDHARVPEGAMEINVVGKQWMWKIQHPNGRREVNALHVPKGRPIKLMLTSQDVIHSFFIPAFRSKMDVLPNRYTSMWFEPEKVGKYRLFCAEYCGTEHSLMGGWVYVMEPDAYEEWLTEGNVRGATTASSPEAAGEKLFAELGCVTCHQQEGPTQRGPTLAGVFGSEVKLNTGETVEVDEDYIRESILYPQKKLVSGYPPLMPTFKNLVQEEDVMNLISYIKSLEDKEGTS